MSKHLCTGLLRGRPYGGVGFLWRKNWVRRIKVVAVDDHGRGTAVMILTMILSQLVLWECMGFILNSVEQSEDAIVTDDLNFQIVPNHPDCVTANRIFSELQLSNYD